MVGDEGRPIRVELPSKQVVWVRVAGSDSVGIGSNTAGVTGRPSSGLAQDTGGRLRSRSKEDSEGAGMETRRLIGFAEAIGGIAESVQASLKKARPDTVEVEFGLDIDVATGQVVSLITEAHAAASMKVKLGWDLAARAEAVRAGLLLDTDLEEESDDEPPAELAVQIIAESLVGTEGGDDD
jgi:NTP-dependent ternary system trypsin peptidase co-occuring protein